MSNTTKSGKVRVSVLSLLGAAVVVVSIGVAMALPRRGPDDSEKATFEAQQGPLTISVTEGGTIQAQEQIILKSQVEGMATIIYLIPEGRVVKEGELLVELDASQLEDNLVDQKIRVQNADAAYISSRENLKVVQNQAKSDISKAQLDYDFAREDLKKYTDGEYPNQLKEAKSKIQLADEERKRAIEKLEWSKKLFNEKYISQTELQADELSASRSELDHELAVSDLDLLESYTYKRQLAQLQSDIEQAQLALERVELKAKADIVQAEADLKAKEAELEQQKGKLDKVLKQIENTKIYAPRSGLVVYATSAKSSWRGNDEPLDEGSSIREREELIYLPTAEQMMAQVQIHESNLEKIKVGLPARVSVDALQGKSYVGHVSKIAPLPNAHAMRMNPDVKVYLTEITLEGNNPELRTGMSCEVEVVVDQLDDATYIPVQAVVQTGNVHQVEVITPAGPEMRKVEVGLDNNRMVHIKSGLKKGELVSLEPPLDRGTVALNSEGPQNEAQKEEFQKAIEQAKRTPTDGSGAPRPPTAGEGQPNSGPRADSGPAGAGERPQMTAAQREEMRKRFENMTPEQREEMRKRFENMTPEQRREMRERMQGGAPGGAPGGGAPGGRAPGGERRGGNRGGDRGGA